MLFGPAQLVVVSGKVFCLTCGPCRWFLTNRWVVRCEPSLVVPIVVAQINIWEIECGHGVVSTPKMRRVALLEENERNRKNVTGVQITIFVK